jgi:hypothetical protein
MRRLVKTGRYKQAQYNASENKKITFFSYRKFLPNEIKQSQLP